MPRIRELRRCRAYVVTERDAEGRPFGHRPCLAPATRDGHPDCEHGDAARVWVDRYAPLRTDSRE
jgi:hypothetical protein